MSFTAPTINWAALVPVLIILGTGVLGVLVEAFVPRRSRPTTQTVLALIGVLASGVAVVMRWSVLEAGTASGTPGQVAGGFVEDYLSVSAQGIMIVLGLLAVLVMADRTSVGDGAFAAQAADRPGSAEETESLRAGWTTSEVFPLTLFSLAGMMLFPAADDLIALFVTLELISLPLYVLAATARHRRLLSQEAAIKYFVLGAFASAFLLMGSALLYGFSGSITYADLLAAIATPSLTDPTASTSVVGMDWLALAGIILVTVGLLFKVAAVPFHAWSPDVYQGSPTPITGFMAAGVKAAAFLTLVRFYYVVAAGMSWDLAPFLWTVAVLTMLLGTVVGLVQRDVKRMLAYSAIAHAGFILIGVIGLNAVGIEAVLFYVLTYAVATVGAFGVVTLVRENHDGAAGAEATDLDQWRGLGRRSPWLAGAMTVFLLSFAGIPLTAGFMGKFQVFLAGIAGGATWLVVLAVACSAATAFFYMRLIVLMFFHEPSGEGTVVVDSQGLAMAAIGLAVVATVALGVWPQPVVSLLARATMLVP